MGCRRRSIHRRPFLKVTGAERTADLADLTGRLRRALGEAEVLGLEDVRGPLDRALRLADRHAAGPEGAGAAPQSIGQHEPVA